MENASRKAVEYATQYENPVLVMGDSTYIRERLDYGKYSNRRVHPRAPARLQARIEERATEAGIPVNYANPTYTPQACHSCHRIARRNAGAEFRCPNDDCRVSTFRADIDASANIARRVDSRGEGVPLDRAERDDSPRDGCRSDKATTPVETTITGDATRLSKDTVRITYHRS